MKRLLGFALLLIAAVLIALPLLRNRESRPLDEVARAEAPGQFVTLSHGAVHYREQGPNDGATVVLVPGFSVPSYVWEPLDARLAAAGFHVVTYDLYGRGWSARPDVTYDRELFASQLRELLDALGIERAHVVGLSMGGAVSARFAATQPLRVERLALVAPLTHARDITPLQWPVVGEWLMRTWLLPKLAAGQMSDFVHPERHSGWSERFVPQMRFHGFGRALLSTLRNVMTADSLGDFAAVGAQRRDVLLVWGRQDSVVPFAHADAVRGAIPGLRLLAVDDAGHLPHVEQADVVAAAMIAFLRGDDPDTTATH